SKNDGASFPSDDEDEEEEAKGEATLFPFSLIGFLEMSKGFMTRSWNVNVVKHVSGACIYVIPITNGAKEIFFKKEFPSPKFRTIIIYIEFVWVSMKLGLSGSRNGDVLSNKVMLRSKEATIRITIKRL
ncbi:hypothetical protein Tco_0639920, partial [Tanacetum coccineum]